MDWSIAKIPVAGRPDPPAPILVRTLWTTAKSARKPITAAIYQTETGLELRIHVGGDIDDLVDSLLSRDGELPLTCHADERMAALLEHGWEAGWARGTGRRRVA